MKENSEIDFAANRDLSHINKVSEHDYSEAEKAGFLIRFVASVIDGIIFNILFVAMNQIFIGKSAVASPVKALAFVLLYQMMISFLIYCLPLYYNGQTLGKKLLKIKVIPVDGQKMLSMNQILKREWLGKFLSLIVFMIGFIWAKFDKKSQAWHDKIAKTYVVKV
jgi:uncharacterized RDD family membrane protein YckC